MSLYHVGDVVIIRDDLVAGEHYASHDSHGDSLYCNYEMADLRGKTATILRVRETLSGATRYRIDADSEDWMWTDGMFSGFASDELEIEIDLNNLF